MSISSVLRRRTLLLAGLFAFCLAPQAFADMQAGRNVARGVILFE